MEMPLRRHPIVVGTVAAVAALAIAFGAAAAWTALDDDEASLPEPEVELRFTPEDDESQSLVAADATGDPVPPDSFPLLGGGLASLTDYAGRPLVLNFFGSWCAPCIREMPEFEEVHQELGDEVAFLGVAVRDSERDAAAIVERTGVSYDIGRDPSGKLFAELGVVAMPSTYLISADGRIIASRAGEVSAAELRALVQQHLTSP